MFFADEGFDDTLVSDRFAVPLWKLIDFLLHNGIARRCGNDDCGNRQCQNGNNNQDHAARAGFKAKDITSAPISITGLRNIPRSNVCVKF